MCTSSMLENCTVATIVLRMLKTINCHIWRLAVIEVTTNCCKF